MFGFLFKILFIAAVVGGIGYFVMVKKGTLPKSLSQLPVNQILSQLPLNKTAIAGMKNAKPGDILAGVSGQLDNLVTHNSGGGGPMVLGVKVSNDSVGTVVDVLQSLPKEQIDQIRSALCASPSSK